LNSVGLGAFFPNSSAAGDLAYQLLTIMAAQYRVITSFQTHILLFGFVICVLKLTGEADRSVGQQAKWCFPFIIHFYYHTAFISSLSYQGKLPENLIIFKGEFLFQRIVAFIILVCQLQFFFVLCCCFIPEVVSQ